MQVIGLPILEDNYAWIIYKDKQCVVVDPGEAQPVIDFVEEKQWTLTHILITHEHEDHIDGVQELINAYPHVVVFGPETVKPLVDEVVHEGDAITILEETFFILHLPGHSVNHIAYHGQGHLFSGDVLFGAGCGRVFTGDYHAQYESLQRLKKLPGRTLVYAGHENTRKNLEFAHQQFPDNKDIQLAIKQVDDLYADDLPSLPTAISQEMKVNPFFLATDLEDFIQLRQKRDQF